MLTDFQGGYTQQSVGNPECLWGGESGLLQNSDAKREKLWYLQQVDHLHWEPYYTTSRINTGPSCG